jgi:CBS domain-containing protein
MSVEQQVDALATSVENLKSAVVSKKATLDASVVDAQSATAQAQNAKTNALSARDQAGAFKDAAYTAAQSAASAVAYQDLTAVAVSKAVTAVDVFIYDTAKDSDGGAWRHRCAGASWYREPLNTATRGARREFPAVAIILVEGGVVRIYDADDPALPIWMVFEGGYNNIVALGSGYFFTSACAKNGVLAVGHADGARAGLDVVNFIADVGKHYGTTEHPLNVAHGSSAYKGNVAQRNAALGNVHVGNIGLIANNTVNDVAMTVLPDAPIDPATRLPVPTIALATAGGVSVIKDDGTLVSRTLGFPVVGQVSFSADHYLFFNSGVFADAGGMFRAFVGDRPSILIEISLGATAGYGGTGINLGGNTGRLVGGVHSRDGVFVYKDGGTSATNPNWDGPNLTLLNDDRTNKNRSMIAAVRSNFSTGWLPGDIKGAFLADTEDADLVGAVAFSDGFSNYADDAALQAAWTRRSTADTGLTMLSGGLRLENLTAAVEWASRTFPTVPGASYRVKARRVDAGSGLNPRVLIGPGNFNGGLLTLQFQVNGEIEGYFRATGSSTFLGVTTNSGALGAFAVFDDIEVVLADADRSVNNRGLVINGTITRAPVAMGAELVGYAGGGANYLSRDFAGA